ncbi:DUF6460 domain-containing protein [Magnetovibrio blakemorei]|uniref:DUF6460 domain-containing protein n=1 Tax=Magnetovibrio blakemorei TaxID=28181 RepID=A0A1E5Q851_9PROT|nr:DUF6460 domain-containing protein [Magnetovibrio blakemorei]OEJ66906.1 hypothetical protein BEN30_10940 [Magnetovibrio blakemorei]
MAAAPRIPVLKLLIWCLIIGLLLAWFNASPEGVYAWAGETGKAAFNWLWNFGQRIGPYILMGAMLVLPIWAVMFLWNWFKTR